MSEVKWNVEQTQAISAREGNYLISASAGSGKTAVLTERVYQLISEGTKLDELLILTFTNMAAASMRNKIRDKLNENYLEKLASQIDAVSIQTFDAFALDIVKKYHYLINLSSDIKIVDASVIELEKKKILESIFLRKYEENDFSFTSLISKYCLDKDDNIRDFILKIDNKADLKINKLSFLDSYLTEFNSKEKILENLDNLKEEILTQTREFISLAKTFENIDYSTLLLDYLYRFENVKTFDELLTLFHSEYNVYPATRGKCSLKDCEEDSKKNDFIKKQMKEKIPALLNYESSSEIINRYEESNFYIKELIDITKEMNITLSEFKKKYGIYTFSDIFKFAMQIVSIKEIRDKLTKKYRYIMIDEYQDTNDLQEEFINMFASNNVYVVGDVKQSIYRFRNANCDLFLNKFNSYPKYDKEKKSINNRIDLPKNYRSRKEVLETVNELFGNLMTINETGLDYQKDHTMFAGNDYLSSFRDPEFDYKTSALCYTNQEKETNIEHEARMVAKDIISKINSKIQIQTKDGSRDITYCDFAILSYSKTDFKIYQQIFEEYKIPLYAKYSESIHESNLTIVLENIIKAMTLIKDNKDETSVFTHMFMSIARSFLFRYSDEDISFIINEKKIKTTSVYKTLIKTIKDTESKNLKDTITTIITNFDIYQKAITIGNISKSIELLNYYYHIASQMDDMRYSLNDFERYFEELEEYDIDPDYESSDSSDNSVKLLTIHASKGLEYRFVYFVRLNKQFNNGDISNKFLVDNTYGIDLPDNSYKNISNINHYLIARKEKYESLLEQLRVFYVALTRAQEHIILVIREDYKINIPYSILDATSYMDFVSIANLSYRRIEESEEVKVNTASYRETKPITLTLHQEISLSDEVITLKRASKEVDDASSELLALGNKYHYYLELIDFKDIDTSFIKDDKDRKLITRFLSNPLFHKDGLIEVAHEYEFFDEVNNVHGFIDLLLIYKDHIDIIDFKLSHVDDTKYERQLSIYKDYVSQISTLPIKTYVTGILSGDIKEIS